MAAARVVLARQSVPYEPWEGGTGKDGRFLLESLSPGEYYAWVIAAGWAPARKTGIAVQPKATTRLELRLVAPGFSLEGTVTAGDHTPIKGAKLTASGGAPTWSDTDRSGRYRLDLGKGRHRVWIRAEGYAPSRFDIDVVGPMTRSVRLMRPARIVGRTVEAKTGEPVPDAKVSLIPATEMPSTANAQATTNASGSFEFAEVEPGAYQAIARSGPLVAAIDVVAVAGESRPDGVILELKPGASISGKVQDDRNQAVGQARVSASNETRPHPSDSPSVRTDDGGRYEIVGLVAGTYRLLATIDEHRSASVTVAVGRGAAVGDIDITVPQTAQVVGRVTTAAGKQAAGVHVVGKVQTGQGLVVNFSSQSTMTDPEGRFRLPMAPGTLQLFAENDDVDSARVGPIDLRPGETKTVDMTLTAGGALSGQIRFDDGRPAAGIRVVGVAEHSRRPTDAVAVTGPDGRYRLRGLPSGRILVRAGRDDHPSPPGKDDPGRRLILLREREHKDDVDLVVPATSFHIQGVALGEKGEPIPGVLISVDAEPGDAKSRIPAPGLARTHTAPDGQFSVGDLPKGTYTLRVVHPSYSGVVARGVRAGDARVTVRVPPLDPALRQPSASEDNVTITSETN